MKRSESKEYTHIYDLGRFAERRKIINLLNRTIIKIKRL